MLTLTQLHELIAAGKVDTVIVAFADMQGRLTGKRVAARLFIEEVARHGAECCNYLLAVDVDMNTVDGYAMSSWDTGYGDMVMTPDFATLRHIPWLPGTALVMADLSWDTAGPVALPVRQAPRSILARQIIRLGMVGAGMYCEGVKGECNLGQQEIAFRYDRALVTCDNHTIYKNGAKEIADKHGKSLTFMAKFDEREGNSCHIHISLRDADGSAVFADQGAEHGMSELFRTFIAGQLATLRELTLFYAPNINSYKRFVDGSFAPTAVAWGLDNRTCALRVVGHGSGMRMECRAPGGDVNQYLAVAALIAGGLHGIEQKLELPEPLSGNAYDGGGERLPTTLAEAADLFSSSRVAREAFGDDVVEHYLNNARVEHAAYNSAVTDWERVRGFERL